VAPGRPAALATFHGAGGHGHREGFITDAKSLPALEGAVTVSQQYADCIVPQIGRDDVGLAVAVDVGHDQREGLAPNRIGLRWAKAAVTISQKNAHCIAEIIGDDKVRDAIAIDIREYQTCVSVDGRPRKEW
jgi:hypothetical protein